MLVSTLVAMLTMAMPTAEAGSGPYMWGVGPSLSTIAYPGRFPSWYPKDVREGYGFEQVKGDVGLGAKGMIYLDAKNRVGARAVFGFGDDYNSSAITGEYDRYILGSKPAYVFAGGGVGFGQFKFSGDDTAELRVPTYLFRGQVTGVYRHDSFMVDVSLFLQFVIPGYQELSDGGGEEEISGGFYTHGGLDATIYFGDFKPPKKKKR
jgi:hypothetical protein